MTLDTGYYINYFIVIILVIISTISFASKKAVTHGIISVIPKLIISVFFYYVGKSIFELSAASLIYFTPVIFGALNSFGTYIVYNVDIEEFNSLILSKLHELTFKRYETNKDEDEEKYKIVIHDNDKIYELKYKKISDGVRINTRGIRDRQLKKRLINGIREDLKFASDKEIGVRDFLFYIFENTFIIGVFLYNYYGG